MGAFLDKPKTEKEESHGEGNGIRWGVSAMQGWRMEMEDAHLCSTKLQFGEDYSFFGVFDGHAGPKVAQYCSQNLLKFIAEAYKKSNETTEDERIKQSIHKGFLDLDENVRNTLTDDRSGTTAIVCLITPGKIYFGNCGDSRGFLCRSGQCFFATADHKPVNDKERLRIEKAGGTVIMQRVNGSLAVSRALGDFDYKRSTDLPAIDQLVSPEPEVDSHERDLANDEYLLLACDGIYDVMTNDAVVEYVSHQLPLEKDLSKICSSLIDTCLNKNSRDNMSVILVTFPGAPQYSEEALKEEKKLIEVARGEMEKKIAGLVDAATDPLDIEENSVLDQLDKLFSDKYLVYSQRQWISQYLAERRKEKFGNDQEEEEEDGNFMGYSDSADAPENFRQIQQPFVSPFSSESTSSEPQAAQSPLSDPDTPAKEGNKSPATKTIM